MSTNSWEHRRLGDLFRIKHGYAFKGEYFSSSGSHVVLTPGNFFDEGGFKLKGDKEKYYTGEIPSGFILRRGDLLVAMTEQAEGLLGSSALIPESDRYLHNQRLGLIVDLDEEVDKGFLYYLFNFHGVRDQIRGSASGTKVRHTSPSRIYEVKITLPPLSTQRKISSILSAYDDLVENNTRRIQILEEMAQAIYREWFIYFRFPGHEKVRMVDSPLGSIPEQWNVELLGSHIALDKGLSYKGKGLTENGCPMVNLKNVLPNGGFRRDATKPYSGEYKSRHTVQPGDLILANTDLTQAGNVIGSPAIVPRITTDHDILISHHIYAVRWLPQAQVTRYFLYGLLQTYEFKGFAKGNANGTTVLGLPREGVLGFQFVKPDTLTLEHFESLVGPMYETIELYEIKNDNLRRTRDLLLPKLISGEVSVEDVSERVLG